MPPRVHLIPAFFVESFMCLSVSEDRDTVWVGGTGVQGVHTCKMCRPKDTQKCPCLDTERHPRHVTEEGTGDPTQYRVGTEGICMFVVNCRGTQERTK